MRQAANDNLSVSSHTAAEGRKARSAQGRCPGDAQAWEAARSVEKSLTRFIMAEPGEDGARAVQALVAVAVVPSLWPQGRSPLIALASSIIRLEADGRLSAISEGRIFRADDANAVATAIEQLAARGKPLLFDEPTFAWLGDEDEAQLLAHIALPPRSWTAPLRALIPSAGNSPRRGGRWFAPVYDPPDLSSLCSPERPGLAIPWGGAQVRLKLLRLCGEPTRRCSHPDAGAAVALAHLVDRQRLAMAMRMASRPGIVFNPLDCLGQYNALCSRDRHVRRNRQQMIDAFASVVDARLLWPNARRKPARNGQASCAGEDAEFPYRVGRMPRRVRSERAWRLVGQRVDAGHSRVDALCEVFGLSARTVRHLARRHREGTLGEPGHRLLDWPGARRLLDATPVEFWPRAEHWSDWLALARYWSDFLVPEAPLSLDPKGLVNRPFAVILRRLPALAVESGLFWPAESATTDQVFYRSARYLQDMTAFAKQSGRPSRPPGVSLATLIRKAGRWERVKRTAARLALSRWASEHRRIQGWPRALPGGGEFTCQGQSFHVREIGDPRALAELAERMGNCALDYLQDCAMGLKRLFEATDAAGRTACIGLTLDTQSVGVEDVRMCRNTEAPAEFEVLAKVMADTLSDHWPQWDHRVKALQRISLLRNLPPLDSDNCVAVLTSLPVAQRTRLLDSVWPAGRCPHAV